MAAGWSSIALVILIFSAFGVPTAELTRDPAQQDGFAWYLGLLSHFGVVLWLAAAAFLLVAAHEAGRSGLKNVRRGLLALGLLTGMVAADDFFMIHERLDLEQGIHQAWIFGGYMMTGVAILALHWQGLFARSEVAVFALAAFLFLASVLIDLNVLPGGTDVEDLCKLAGIVAYTCYCRRLHTVLSVGRRLLFETSNGEPVQLSCRGRRMM